MKAIRVKEFGGPEVLQLEDVPTPQPGPGEVLMNTFALWCDAFAINWLAEKMS